jgi:uncharacterized protein involved in exopolysaccharide biosynthesis
MKEIDFGALVHEESQISVPDLWIKVVEQRRMILGVTLAVTLLALVISLLIPNVYTGTVKILPPQQSQSSASALLNQVSGLLGMSGSSLGGKNPNDLYVTMLKSRTVTEKIVNRFDLIKVYDQDSVSEAIKKLNKNVSVMAGKEGVITVEVEDYNPKRAAELANAYVQELDKMMQSFALTDASQKRNFFEQQLRASKDKLTNAEITLDQTPKTSLQYLDAVRNLRYQESVFEILAKQFEMAKLDESKNYPLIQVLDKASPPEERTRPKRAMIVGTAAAVALFLALALVYWSERQMRIRRNRPA